MADMKKVYDDLIIINLYRLSVLLSFTIGKNPKYHWWYFNSFVLSTKDHLMVLGLYIRFLTRSTPRNRILLSLIKNKQVDCPKCQNRKTLKGAFRYDVRCFGGIFDLPTYPNQILYYISLFSKIRCSLTYLPT